MKVTGLVFIVFGALLMIYGFFMPIDVAARGPLDRVSNLGLMHKSQMTLTAGGFVFLAGCVLSAVNQLSESMLNLAPPANEEPALDPAEVVHKDNGWAIVGGGAIVVLTLVAMAASSQFAASPSADAQRQLDEASQSLERANEITRDLRTLDLELQADAFEKMAADAERDVRSQKQ